MGTGFLMPKFSNLIYRDCLLVSYLATSLLGIIFVILRETVAVFLVDRGFKPVSTTNSLCDPQPWALVRSFAP